jgi:hypothetical protein
MIRHYFSNHFLKQYSNVHVLTQLGVAVGLSNNVQSKVLLGITNSLSIIVQQLSMFSTRSCSRFKQQRTIESTVWNNEFTVNYCSATFHVFKTIILPLFYRSEKEFMISNKADGESRVIIAADIFLLLPKSLESQS